MAKHSYGSFNERRTFVFPTDPVFPDSSAEIAVWRGEARQWEFMLCPSEHPVSHRFHSLDECFNPDYCQQRPYDVGSYDLSHYVPMPHM